MSAHLPGFVGMTHGNMNTEPVAAVEPESTEVQPEVKAETEEVVEASTETPAEGTGDEADKALKRMQRRIDKRTADVYRERARAEELARRVAELEAKAPDEVPSDKEDPVTLAREIAKVERFTEKANSIYKDGTKAHTDYTDALKELASEVGPFVLKNGAPSPFMDVVLEVADNPTELLYHLGKNPDIAEDLAGLSQIQLAKRLDRIEREMTDKSKPKTGSAPKPLEPVKPKAVDSELGPGLSDAEWMRRREAQLRERRG